MYVVLLDILIDSKFDVLDSINNVEIFFYADENKQQIIGEYFNRTQLQDMRIDTRSIFPTDEATFSINDIKKDKIVKNVNIIMSSDKKFDYRNHIYFNVLLWVKMLLINH